MVAPERPKLQGPVDAVSIRDRWKVFAVAVFIAGIIGAVFGQTLHFQFVNLDDNEYVYENLHVAGDLSLGAVGWAFTHAAAHNWHPLTWLSLMLDHQVYGLKPGGFHLANIVLHGATAILLFIVLRQMTGFLWRSACVAALFAVHPQHVESVAWVSERKDVLSGLFFVLTLWAYARHVRERSRVEGRESRAGKAFDPRLSTLDYCGALFFFACGLMSKPMLVTVPAILLLLDYWPLNRVRNAEHGMRSWRNLVLEKLPFMGLAALSCVATVFAQYSVIQPFKHLSLSTRIGNAAVSYAAYIGQMFYPRTLVAYYPFPEHGFAVWQLAGAIGLLVLVSIVFVAWRSRRPYLLAGWLWYLIMLVPVIGIVQVGTQSRADRYTYLPEIGLYMALIWLVAELWPNRRRTLGVIAAIVIGACAVCAWGQATYWRNSETLWRHALTLPANDDVPGLHDNLGTALDKEGRMDEAMVEYRKALAITPDFANAHNNLGFALFRKHRLDEAIEEYQAAVESDPSLVIARSNLGNALLRAGRPKEAVEQFEEVLKMDPEHPTALNSLAWVMATSPDASLRNGTRAVALAEQINRITGGKLPECLDTLAAAQAEAGKFDEAVLNEQRAIDAAQAAGNKSFAEEATGRLKLYQAKQPYRDGTTTSAGH